MKITLFLISCIECYRGLNLTSVDGIFFIALLNDDFTILDVFARSLIGCDSNLFDACCR